MLLECEKFPVTVLVSRGIINKTFASAQKYFPDDAIYIAVLKASVAIRYFCFY